ncbi:MAG: hypothetical protein IPH38_20885 [Candidatus Microthrix sp.]|nr:hypothetical protein [Candidatus Microthrix sp.]MBK7021957.1 hypothetical protein [Candidatus Microthrix sp.]
MYTKADGPGSGAARAEAAARAALVASGRSDVAVSITPPMPKPLACGLARVTVRLQAPLVGGARFRRSRIQDRHRCRAPR